VVDDNATNRTIMTAQLGSWGIAVDVVDSAVHALDALETARTTGRRYDFAVLDMLMPEVDGLELARRVSVDPDLAGLPMIMLSSAPRVAQPVLDEVGVARWLTKPIRAAALYDSIVRLVADTGRCPLEAGETRDRAEAARPTLVRGRVLVVEDNELNQLVARGMVERLGFETDVAGNGVEALEALGSRAYDMVLMDCHMPVMDGFAATERIRASELGRSRTPVVALTASALASDRERCLAAGMDDYLAKPIDPDVLAAVLERWTEAASTAAPEVDGVVPRKGVELSVVRDPHVDPAQIEGLSELRTPDGGSLLATFIASFTRRADNRLETIRSCADRADDEALAMAAHELRGSAATIGAVRVASLCAELEHGGAELLSRRPAVLDDLETELAQVVLELDVIAGQAA
jgi:two-component system sensor histidine kinase/response regulator